MELWAALPDGDEDSVLNEEKVAYRTVEGRVVSPVVTEERLTQLREQWEHRAGDVWVATYPKSGTTWTQKIVLALRGLQDEALHEAFPWVEVALMPWEAAGASPHRLFKSHHWPEGHMGVEDPAVKVIHVLRNPADLAVSYYFHCRGFVPYNFHGTFSQFFSQWMEGKVCDDWARYELAWAAHPTALQLRYEDMLEDPAAAVRAIATHLEVDPALVQDDSFVQGIVDATKFEKMQSRASDAPQFPRNPDMPGFFRKGQARDWESYFSDEQLATLQEHYREVFADNPDLLEYCDKWCTRA